MNDLLFFDVVNCAGVGCGVRAESAEAARLLRLDQIIAALELAEEQGRPRRFDWRALPKRAEEWTGGVVAVSDLYGDAS